MGRERVLAADAHAVGVVDALVVIRAAGDGGIDVESREVENIDRVGAHRDFIRGGSVFAPGVIPVPQFGRRSLHGHVVELVDPFAFVGVGDEEGRAAQRVDQRGVVLGIAQLVARIFETTPDESALEGLHRAAAVGEEAVPGVVFPLLRPFERTFLNIVSQSDLAVVVHLVELDARRVVRVAELETLAFQPFDGGLGIDPLRRGAERRKGRSHEASRQFDVAIFYHNSLDLGGLLCSCPGRSGCRRAVGRSLCGTRSCRRKFPPSKPLRRPRIREYASC